MKPTYRKSWAGNVLMCLDLTLDPSFKVKRGHPNLKVLINCLLLVLEVCYVKPTYRKSWAGILLMVSDLTLSHSCKVKRVQPMLKVLITHLLVLEVCNVKPTCRISWAGNLLMSDLTFGPSFKVERWFTGFGELSLKWIQICIGCPMRRSSCIHRKHPVDTWFSVRYATAAAHIEIFGVNALRGKQQQLASPNLQDIVIGG